MVRDGRASGCESTERQDEMDTAKKAETQLVVIEGFYFNLKLIDGGAGCFAVVSDGFGNHEKRVVGSTMHRILLRIAGEMPFSERIDVSVRNGRTAQTGRYTYLEIVEYVDDIPNRFELRLEGTTLTFVTGYASVIVSQ